MKTFSVLTVSDSCAAGTRADGSGPEIVRIMAGSGFSLVQHVTVPDGVEPVASALRALSAETSLVLTTGGTGLSPRDYTPEATLSVCERAVPGIPEMLRARSAEKVDSAWLGRGCAGIRGNTLIVNLPGSVKAVRECLGFLLHLLPHALDVLAGRVDRCGG